MPCILVPPTSKLWKKFRDQLLNFLWLLEDVCNCPTHLAEVVPTPPSYIGAMDAAKAGIGGVWFPPGPAVPLLIHPHKKNSLQDPCLWRAPFPKLIQQAIVSASANQLGEILNSDLELCGTVAHSDILASTVPFPHLTTCNISDNTPAILAWCTKGSSTTTGPAAYLATCILSSSMSLPIQAGIVSYTWHCKHYGRRLQSFVAFKWLTTCVLF